MSLLKFKDRLRVTIGSGNLASGDWYFWLNIFLKFDFTKKPKINKIISKRKSNYFSHQKLKKRNSKCFKEKVRKHHKKLFALGYDFATYLKEFLEKCMEEKTSELDSFLGIRLEDYDIRKKGVFLIASVPGGYTNLLNYSQPDTIKNGNLTLFYNFGFYKNL